KYTFTKLRILPSSVNRCFFKSENVPVRRPSASPTVAALHSRLDCFPVNWRSGVGIITLTAIRSFPPLLESGESLPSTLNVSKELSYSPINITPLDARVAAPGSTGRSDRFPLAGNPFGPNHFRLKFGTVIIELPGSQIHGNAAI